MLSEKGDRKEKKETKKDKKESKAATAAAAPTEAATAAAASSEDGPGEFSQFDRVQMRVEINELHSKVQDLNRLTQNQAANQANYSQAVRELGHRLDVQHVEGTSTENRLELLAESHMRDAQRLSSIMSRLTSAEEEIRELKRSRTEELEAEISRSSRDPQPTYEPT